MCDECVFVVEHDCSSIMITIRAFRKCVLLTGSSRKTRVKIDQTKRIQYQTHFKQIKTASIAS